MQTNPSLSRVDLQGNHIPKDTLRAIGCHHHHCVWCNIVIQLTVAENQLIENVERSQLEVLTATVANRVRAYHHLRPIVNPLMMKIMTI